MSILGAIGGAIGSIFGSKIAGRDAEDRQNAALAHSDAAKAYDREYNLMLSDREYERQKEFATMGIRWKRDDAVAAGLHPLAALGGGMSGYSPTAIVTGSPQVNMSGGPGGDMGFGAAGEAIGRWLDDSGQNTRRAEVATQNPFERELQVLALRRAELQNQLIEGQIAAQWASVMGQPGNPPMARDAGPASVVVSPVRSPMSAPRGLVEISPSKSVSAAASNAGVEAGSTPFSKEFTLGHGAKVRLPSQAASEPLEALGPLGWVIGSFLNGTSAFREWWKGPEGGPPDPRLEWNPWRQSWAPPSKPRKYWAPNIWR